MYLNKNEWLRLNDYVAPRDIPKLPCPYCLEEALILDLESVSITESIEHACHISVNRSSAEIQKNLKRMAGENDLLKTLMLVAPVLSGEKITPGIFTSTLHCQKCGEIVNGIGSAKFRSAKNTIQTVSIKHEFFCPSIPFFKISNSVPERITQELLQAFNYFHNDISTAGFKLRRAMEKICEDLGYKGKNLHQCIDLMALEHKEEATWLKALKLVGNEATHADGVAATDLLDAFEVFPGILNIFDRRYFSKNASEKIQSLQNKFGTPPPK